MERNFWEDDPSVIADYVKNTNEVIQNMEENALLLEKDVKNSEIADNIFRSLHNIKGSSSMMGFNVIAGFLHAIESAFDGLKKHKVPADPAMIDMLLKCFDGLKGMASDVSEGGNGSGADVREISRELNCFKES